MCQTSEMMVSVFAEVVDLSRVLLRDWRTGQQVDEAAHRAIIDRRSRLVAEYVRLRDMGGAPTRTQALRMQALSDQMNAIAGELLAIQTRGMTAEEVLALAGKDLAAVRQSCRDCRDEPITLADLGPAQFGLLRAGAALEELRAKEVAGELSEAQRLQLAQLSDQHAGLSETLDCLIP